MKRLFLCSSVRTVASKLAQELGNDKTKKMVYITTAVELDKHDDEQLAWYYANRESLVRAGFRYDDYDIAGKSADDLKNDLDKYQIIYVEGGNTFYLLYESLKNNFGEYLRERIGGGLIYISTSAGSIIAGPETITGTRPGKTPEEFGLQNTKGFNLVDFVVCPHWGDPSKKNAYMDSKLPIAYTQPHPFILLNDNQYVEVIDDHCKIIDVTKK